MRPNFIRIAIALAAGVALLGCDDQRRDPLSPSRAPNALITVQPLQPLQPLACRDLFFDCNPWVEIAAGQSHTCARKQNGAVYCWGRADLGQIGVSTTVKCGLSGEFSCVLHPTRVTGVSSTASFTTAIQIAAGADHTCVLATGGAPWCWGSNSEGQTGTGVGARVLAPQLLSGVPAFTSISAGDNYTCAAGVGIYCWGKGQYTPAYLLALSGLSAISVADDHSCVRGGPYNEVFCWGRNDFGQLGLTPLTNGGQTSGWVSQLTGATRVDAAWGYTCADQPNGTVQCFGMNNTYLGTLGNPFFTGSSTYVAQTVSSPNPGARLLLHGVTTGVSHACALDANGAAWCWGNGTSGEVGNGATNHYNAPVPVATNVVFVALAAGNFHTCGIATDRHIWCWGDNEFGELGSTLLPGQASSVPVQTVNP